MEQLRALGAQLLAIWSQLRNQKLTVAASGLIVAVTLAVVVFSPAALISCCSMAVSTQKTPARWWLCWRNRAYRMKPVPAAPASAPGQVHSLRMTLASRGLPKSSGDGKGYELFDEKNTISMSDFVQQVNKKRAIEGELGRSISMISGVKSARVMVVMPETRLIVDEQQKAHRSVMVNLSRKVWSINRPSTPSVFSPTLPGLQHNHVSGG